MQRSTPKILTVNGGSSSIKFALFEVAQPPKKELYGKIDRIGLDGAALNYHDLITDKTGKHPLDTASPVQFLLDWLAEYVDMSSLAGIGHRIVHGMKHHAPERVVPELLDESRRISPYDPEHLPQEIEMMEIFRQRYPELLQVACFDTSFHAAIPHVAKCLPLPRRFAAMGIQRYGFHGLSYAWLMEELARVAGNEAAKGRIILAHLGNGASLAAVEDGQSLDTSMGFTPTSGLVMGTRTGDLDPGVAWFLMQAEKLNPAQFNDLINHQSGLTGHLRNQCRYAGIAETSTPGSPGCRSGGTVLLPGQKMDRCICCGTGRTGYTGIFRGYRRARTGSSTTNMYWITIPGY